MAVNAPLLGHVERHFTAGDVVRDIVIGMADGLTVPFALAAGLSGAATPAKIVVTAGLAEVAAGAISMGLGGLVASSPRACFRIGYARFISALDNMAAVD